MRESDSISGFIVLKAISILKYIWYKTDLSTLYGSTCIKKICLYTNLKKIFKTSSLTVREST